ncbi:hypothetical protein VE04_08527 [Pseudogymnoascus sp. 24MN13]|nr:hypothetical protein VE04_08527 [Pseudogymnoascus sp. 24MN13]
MSNNTSGDLRGQWGNPSDVLSLLLLIGGDIVQKAIAQLVGFTITPFGKTRPIGLTPVAFSFGWVAYGFSNLLSAVGDKRLMPQPESPSIIVNCGNAFARENRSWILGRLLRDHETSHEVDATNPPDGVLPSTSPTARAESIRIDIFELEEPSKPSLDFVWWLGWATIAAQIGIASTPWILYNDWGVMMVALCGNLLALFTCALPQWRQEKWAGAGFRDAENVTCLTRGNGHLHTMVFIGRRGAFNLEVLATATSTPKPETPALSLVLALLWTCLLVSVSGLKEHTWFLVSIGGIGMLQNVYAAGKARHPSTADLYLKPFSRMPTIIGKRHPWKADETASADVNLDDALSDVNPLSEWAKGNVKEIPKWLDSMEKGDGLPAWLVPLEGPEKELQIANTVGALRELEKWVPTAGLAMLQIYFPDDLRFEDSRMRYNIDKQFWKKAYHTKDIRKQAEYKRREVERNSKAEV